MTFAYDSIWSHECYSFERFTNMISFMIYDWLKIVAGNSIRRVTRVRVVGRVSIYRRLDYDS